MAADPLEMAIDSLEADMPDSDGDQEVVEAVDEAEDEFSAWVAETEDVALAAGEVPDTRPADKSKEPGAPRSSEELLVDDDADAAEDDAALLGQLMGLRAPNGEAEQTAARSLLLGPRGSTTGTTEPVAETVVVEAGLDDATAVACELEAPEGEAKVILPEDPEAEVILPEDPEAEATATACDLEALESEAAASLEAMRTAVVESEEAQVEIALDEEEEADADEVEVDIADLTAVQPETPPPAPSTPPPAPQTPPAAKASALDWEDSMVWDVDDLDAQAEAFGTLEASRERSDKSKQPQPVVKGVGSTRGGVVEVDSDEELAETGAGVELSQEIPAGVESGEGLLSQVSSLLDDVRGRLKKAASVTEAEAPLASGAEDVDVPVEEDVDELTALLEAPPRKRPAPATKPMRATAKARSGAQVEKVPDQLGGCDLQHVVVNFVEVGRSYARTVLCKDADDEDSFDWEGVRSCVQCLASEKQLKVVGILPEAFEGEDSWSNQKCGIPEDIRNFCEAIEEAPPGSCSGHTKQLAHRRECRFVDTESRDEDSLQLCYSYDASLGTFSVLEGGASQDNGD